MDSATRRYSLPCFIPAFASRNCCHSKAGNTQGGILSTCVARAKFAPAKSIFPPRSERPLDLFLKHVSTNEGDFLFRSRSGIPLARQHVDRLLRRIARHASAKLPKEEKIRLSAHVLRHTMLRRVTEKNGVQFAMETAGHASSKYIWRYVKPSDEQKEQALEKSILTRSAPEFPVFLPR